MPRKPEWKTMAGYPLATWIQFDHIQVYVFKDIVRNCYRVKIGSEVDSITHQTMDRAKQSGLKLLEKLARNILDSLHKLPEYKMNPASIKAMEAHDQRISILGFDDETENTS